MTAPAPRLETGSRLQEVLRRADGPLLAAWIREQVAERGPRDAALREAELREQCAEFLRLLAAAAERDLDPEADAWAQVRQQLAELSRARSKLGFSPRQTATFVFSLKRPLFEELQRVHDDPSALLADVWTATRLLDRLGLFTTEVHQKAREEVITRQQTEMLELSTPVVSLWEGILALPMIGTLDSERTQVAMQALLERIAATNAPIAILDITGVPMVDTLTAQHLLKTVAAARLMGADCIISGIRPQIAQTVVHLGVDLGGVVTKASLADAFALALRRLGFGVTRTSEPPRPRA